MRFAGLGTLSSMLQLLCEHGLVHAPAAGSSMSDDVRATCARCIGIVVCVVSSSFDSSSPSTPTVSKPSLSPSRRASDDANRACFSPPVVGEVVSALAELLHSAVHSKIVCARAIVSAIHNIMGRPSAVMYFCTIDCCKLLLHIADNCNDASSCTSVSHALRVFITSAPTPVKCFTVEALAGDRLAVLFLAASCAASQAAVIDLSNSILDVTPEPFKQRSVQACIVSSVHNRLATDSVRLKFAPLCMRVLPLLHSENPSLSRVPDLIMSLLSTATQSRAAETKALLLSDIRDILIQQPNLKAYFSNAIAVKLFCVILLTSAHNDATSTTASRTIYCITCDCAAAQEAFDSCDVFAALFNIVSCSASTNTHAEVCRVMVALVRGRGSASCAWCDVNALNNCIRAICDVADARSCEAAAELLDSLAAEMDESFAGALLALGDLPSAVQRLAAASSHWCRVMLLSAVYRLILLEAAFRSLLCSQSLVQAAQDAMMDCKDDYECGTVANAVGELVRGHGANKAAFSCEATCIGLARMAEAAVEQVTVQVDALELLSPCFCVRVVHVTPTPQDVAFLISSISHRNPSIHRSASASKALFSL